MQEHEELEPRVSFQEVTVEGFTLAFTRFRVV